MYRVFNEESKGELVMPVESKKKITMLFTRVWLEITHITYTHTHTHAMPTHTNPTHPLHTHTHNGWVHSYTKELVKLTQRKSGFLVFGTLTTKGRLQNLIVGCPAILSCSKRFILFISNDSRPQLDRTAGRQPVEFWSRPCVIAFQPLSSIPIR